MGPSIGRFLSTDPIGHLGGINLYVYGNNSPVVYVDPAGLIGTPDCCCCCVEDVSIQNIKKDTNLPLYGHTFDAVIKMNFIKDKKIRTDCTLSWGERTNRPVVPGAKPNKWYDAYALLPKSPTFDPWNKRKQPCPGNLTVTIPDEPAADVRLPARQLYFAIKVTSGANCPCSVISVTVYATQILVPDGKGGIKTQDLTLGVPAGLLPTGLP